jgi:hypothetical protein
LPDPGVPDGLKIPLFAISLPDGVPPADALFIAISCSGVISLLLITGTDFSGDSSTEFWSVEKLSGSAGQRTIPSSSRTNNTPAGFTILIIRFLIRNFLAEFGTMGDDAIEDGPGPASAIVVA